MSIKVTIISGPTCSGKSAFAVDKALKENGEIISCDSVQVYKFMDIGSAKLDEKEMRAIRHHLIDVCMPNINFDVSMYVEHSKKAMEEILKRGKNIIVAGGSPFYLQSWFSAVTDNICVSNENRELVKKIELEGGTKLLKEKLLSLDKDAGEFVDLENPRRTSRAIERILQTNKGLKQIIEEFKGMQCPYGELKRDFIMLDNDNEYLEKNILLRTSNMLKKGLVEECEKLLGMGIENNVSAINAIGYKECFSAIKSGNVNTQNLIEEISKNTFKLVKKQRKFLKRFASNI